MRNKDKKILFFGFSDIGYQCLKYLIDEEYYVIGVFTHDTDPHEKQWFKTAESLAKENFIPVFKPSTLKTEKWYRKVKYMQPDLILSLYYRNIIPEEIFSQAKFGAYNMHGSYLPTYRGRAPLNWAIINGENYSGVSLHVLEKTFDTGAIVDQERVEFSENEYVADIQPRITDAGVKLFKRSLEKLLDGNPQTTPQDESKATYFGKRTPEDGRIDFNKSAKEVYNLIRALSKPFPGAFAKINGTDTTIRRAKIGDATDLPAGTIANTSPLAIACSDKLIVVEEFEERQ
ncbi:MAG: formyltransferase [Opitutales bacterium]|nr:formyltransferase [Opitutales bacterium]